MRRALLAFALLAALPANAAAETFGRSVDGRALKVTRLGPVDAPRTILAVGSVHGDETAGHAVIRALRRRTPPPGVQVHLVTTANPDGVRAGTRQNARGVDLNRNFPRRWRAAGRRGDVYYPGPRAASEPETRALARLVRRIDPDVTVYFHQHMRLVNYAPGADRRLVRAYARRVRLPARELPHYRGTATSWQNHRDADSSAFVVELPAGPLSRRAARRHARAVLATATTAASAAAAKPHVQWDPIPFGKRRIRQTRAYARRHYGLNHARLIDPKVIVEHYTATTTYGPVFNTFASNARDPELGELPGTCAHYVVDTDGTIHQLVRLKWMCRHTVGLNHTAIGIEHVGTSDDQVLADKRQLRASLRLTRWLQARHGIATRDVIGHAESLGSPYHHEDVARLRTQTHGDMGPRAMKRYRRKL
ncbi:MAG TPA: DUF2817 domain-containing protein [Solirubrobacteraceae bacterium]|jgi:beta-N-acetylhexosaminidase